MLLGRTERRRIKHAREDERVPGGRQEGELAGWGTQRRASWGRKSLPLQDASLSLHLPPFLSSGAY